MRTLVNAILRKDGHFKDREEIIARNAEDLFSGRTQGSFYYPPGILINKPGRILAFVTDGVLPTALEVEFFENNFSREFITQNF